MDASRATVECGDELHTIALEGGRLSLLHHPGTGLESERVLAALGASVPECVRVLNAVDLARTDAALWLYLLDPTAEAELTELPIVRAALLLQPLGPMPFDVQRDLELRRHGRVLLALPRLMRFELGVTIARDWARRWDDPATSATIKAGLTRMTGFLAQPEIRRFVHPDVPIDFALGEPDVSVGVTGERVSLVVRLRPGWLADVWWPGLPHIEDAFVVDATIVPDGVHATVTTARWVSTTAQERARHASGARPALIVRDAVAVRDSGTWTLGD